MHFWIRKQRLHEKLTEALDLVQKQHGITEFLRPETRAWRVLEALDSVSRRHSRGCRALALKGSIRGFTPSTYEITVKLNVTWPRFHLIELECEAAPNIFSHTRDFSVHEYVARRKARPSQKKGIPDDAFLSRDWTVAYEFWRSLGGGTWR